MDIVTVLVSFNKISIVAFFITFAFILYELYLFKKEATRGKRPTIPKFEENAQVVSIRSPTLVAKTQEMVVVKKPNSTPLYIGIFFLVIFGVISLLGFINIKNSMRADTKIQPTPFVIFVSSKGIKAFTLDWKELTDTELSKLKGGDSIIIGIEAIKDAGIDRARIRVNETEWKLNHITLNFDKMKNVYYKEYTVSSGAASLKIEAQLHSKSDGWLGD